MPKLIDTHCHLNFNAYKDDTDEVIKRTLKEDVWMVNVGSQSSTSERAVRVAQKYRKGVYASVGLHPAHLCESYIDEEELDNIYVKTRQEDFNYNYYKKLAQNNKVVAIGETGLDYTYLPKNCDCDKKEEIKKQKKVFCEHIKLAKELNLPLIIHCRDTHGGALKILNKEQDGNLRAVTHCYTGNWGEAKTYLGLGFLISFTGIITFKINPKQLDLQKRTLEVVLKTPLEKIMIETDAPYLTPEPRRGKRNEPLYVEFVARKIAEIKGLNFEKVAEQTTKNAIRFFNL